MKTVWDLENLYYKSLDDPQIEKDVKAVEDAYIAFAEKYSKDKSFLSDPKALKEAFVMLETFAKTGPAKPLYYLFFVKDLDAANTKAMALDAKISERYTKAGNKITFFDVELGKVSKEQQKIFLDSEELVPYRYYLSELFENAKFTLSEKEENILSLKSEVASSRWVNMTSTIEAKKIIPFSNGDLPLPEALERLNELPKEERRELWGSIVSVLKDMGEMSGHELNALVTNHKINGELRGYKTPEEPTIRGNENKQEVIDLLAASVTAAFPDCHEFYKTKARVLGENILHYEDKNIDIGAFSTKFTFEKSANLVKEAFGNVNPLYADLFQSFLDNGQIDVYPKKGKTGGAFCAHETGIPTMLLLNHVDTIRSFETLAHEMGHAIHSERSKKQPPFYEGYSTAVAETASTFFEQVVRDALIKELPKEEQFLLLHNSIQNDVSSIFRQTTAFNFERDLHQKIRTEGFVSEEEIAKLLATHLRRQLGESVKVEDDDGYSFVYWSHFRNFFYVYTYAYGQLVSKALFKRFKEDASYAKEIDMFLSAGGSMKAEEIFENIGLSFENGAVFKEGLSALREDIEVFKKQAK